MNERHARDVTWLEAFETARPPAPTWSDEDRAWADRVALEAVAAQAPADVFVADRARHALQRLGPREPALERIVGATTWRSGWVRAVALVAFVLGVAADAIGSGQRINLLAPPLWGVLLWNAVVYAVLIVWPLVRVLRRTPAKRGPIVRATEALLHGRRLPRASAAGSATAIRRFASLWLERSGALAALRAETVLHAGAAALALGLVVGIYARGLVLDYRVVWESTLLDPSAAHAVVTTAFGPAARLAAIALPDETAFAALRATRGDTVVGAPAAPWIHLIALTLLGAVVLPRTLLALGCAAIAAARTRRFALSLDAPYFQRLLRLRKGGPARVSVHPYGIAPTPQATLGLRALLAAALGPQLALEFAPTVAFGREDDAAPAVDPAATQVVALFDLGATPELENQGRFLRALLTAAPGGAVVATVVDATAFSRRFAAVGARVAERRDAWRAWGDAVGAAAVVIALEDADAAAAEAELQAAFALPGARAAP
ncbi:MAG TPA: DUF2868 domain-containing protein [Caldimonas sp.]|jgi:hypothetical protein